MNINLTKVCDTLAKDATVDEVLADINKNYADREDVLKDLENPFVKGIYSRWFAYFHDTIISKDSEQIEKSKYVCVFSRSYEIEAENKEIAKKLAWIDFEKDDEDCFINSNGDNFSLNIICVD